MHLPKEGPRPKLEAKRAAAGWRRTENKVQPSNGKRDMGECRAEISSGCSPGPAPAGDNFFYQVACAAAAARTGACISNGPGDDRSPRLQVTGRVTQPRRPHAPKMRRQGAQM